ncbi:MAG: transglycosylase SLT domain-containing protein [bacterium]|nr:transglycosylase SLT domain-containing protein [bacterium]
MIRSAARLSARALPPLAILVVIGLLLPGALDTSFGAFSSALNRFSRYYGETRIAPLFTEQVDHWADSILRWAQTYDLDPNLLATVMQIESCGHSEISSVAGAQGLFQVMPFHFSEGEVYTDPETNARRGASFLRQCIGWADGSAERAMACYNGGPGVLSRALDDWPSETQRYFSWGSRIYNDARLRLSSSPALDEWLNAGGQRLCDQASAVLGIR